MNVYYFGQALGLSALYMIGGLGALVTIKSGDFNLGGEGQIYAGGFICAVILNQFANLPALVAIPLTFLITFVAGALLGLISSGLKNLKGANPLFTSFIASCAIIPLIDGAIAGRFRTTSGNLLATEFIPVKFRFPSIWQPSNLNGFIFVSIILCILCWLFFKYTSLGRKLTIYGISENFTQLAGYKNHQLCNFSFAVSGGLHAICGAVTVCGTYYTCHSGFYSGIGWNSLSSALIALLNPLLLIPSSVFMAFVITYSNKYALLSNLGFDLSSLIQGIILFTIAFPVLSKKHLFLKKGVRK